MTGGKRGEERGKEERKEGERRRERLGYWHGFFLVLAAVERQCVTQAARERPFKKLLFHFRA